MELAEHIKLIRNTPNDRPDMMSAINALVDLLAEMHKVSTDLKNMRGSCFIPNHDNWWDDAHETSHTKANALLTELKESE